MISFYITMLCAKWNEGETKEGFNMGSCLHSWQIGKWIENRGNRE
ncbi:hypothetical protein BuS5_03750 [Desulfosarcina sp. BuS5]|nr:hypothetical protein BuS5_03750 [Desulfosarcina sp. BuS5]